MALTVSEVDLFPPKNNDPLPDPPPSDVPLVTPAGDIWPRPYFLENGLRRVAPYHYTYNTFCKQRWRDRALLDIFASEFRDRTPEYYKDAISAGRVVINGKQVPVDYVLKNGEVISHTLHRHEPPVSAQPIKALSEDEDMIVIDKPAGIPVHPAGRYRFNSVVEIMRAERDHAFNPLPCNRLDRLTSGVMFIGKNAVAAEDISAKLRERTVRKEYLARVKGRFPDGDENGVTVCEENVVTVSPILGLNRVREGGKSAKTLFKRLAYYPGTPRPSQQPAQKIETVDGEVPTDSTSAPNLTPGAPIQTAPPPSLSVEDDGYSIVHCLPLTGRTHQIRVHLQFLGHPISNDPIYSNRRVFGPLLGKNDSSAENDADIIARLSEMGKTESFASAMESSKSTPKPTPTPQSQSSTPTPAAASAGGDYHSDPAVKARGESANPSGSELVAAFDAMVADYEKSRGEKMTGELCEICDTPLYSDPGPHELGIYLHAICYRDLGEAKTGNGTIEGSFRAGGWSYKSEVPEWAWPIDAQEATDSTASATESTGIKTFTSWNDSWSVGLMHFDRETVVPNGGKMKGHQ